MAAAGHGIESVKEKWRARLCFRVQGLRKNIRGPSRDLIDAARRDLAVLLCAQGSASTRGGTAYEAVAAAAAKLKEAASGPQHGSVAPRSACADTPSERAEVLELARRTVEAMKNGNRSLAHETLTSLLCHPTGLDEAWVEGRTLLAEAVRWECADVVSTLLDYGADANAASRSPRSQYAEARL